MKELKDILTFQNIEFDVDSIIMNIVMAAAFVWLIYTIQHLPTFG